MQKAAAKAKFDDYASDYHHRIDHVCRRLVSRTPEHFTRLKFDELAAVAAKLDACDGSFG